MTKRRYLFFYKDYFDKFYVQQTNKVQKKILWTLRIIEELNEIPKIYFKHLKNTSGIYEIRVRSGNNIFRIFCFFDTDKLIVIGHGFQKKSQKTPQNQIKRAEQIKLDYHANKE